jgi:signal transduction histidine kinase
MNPEGWLPKSLFGRMTLILVAGLLAAQFTNLYLHLQAGDNFLAGGSAAGNGPAIGPVPLRFLWHLALTLVVVVAVSLIAVRWVTRPLQRWAAAATAFAHDLDAAPLAEAGPTEVRRAAEAFNVMQARLRLLVVERGRALAAVSHDLRTPLTRMRLRTELIDDPALQAKLNADIDTMRSMVNGVLAYLRGLEDAEPMQSLNMEALLHSIVEDERSLGRQVEGAERAADAAAPAPYAGKLSILRRAISNLIDNALAHGNAVTVRLADSPAELRIVIEDDGPGIPEADLPRVTEPYVRLDASRSLESGGVGLGLAIVRDAAAYHGGRLVLENRRRGGLRASLVLPRPGSSRN